MWRGPRLGMSPEESGEEARSMSFGNLSLEGDKRWCSAGTRKGSGLSLRRRLHRKRSFYLGCLFMRLGSVRASGDYIIGELLTSHPSTLPWRPTLRASPTHG